MIFSRLFLEIETFLVANMGQEALENERYLHLNISNYKELRNDREVPEVPIQSITRPRGSNPVNSGVGQGINQRFGFEEIQENGTPRPSENKHLSRGL